MRRVCDIVAFEMRLQHLVPRQAHEKRGEDRYEFFPVRRTRKRCKSGM